MGDNHLHRGRAPKDGAGLCFQRPAKGDIHDNRAVAFKGERANQFAKIADHLSSGGKVALEPAAAFWREEVDNGQAVRPFFANHVELGNVDGGKIARHRVAGFPDKGATVTLIDLIDQQSVGCHHIRFRCGDAEGVSRLIQRVVVDRKPRHGSRWLTQYIDSLLIIIEPADCFKRHARIRDWLRHAAIGDRDGEGLIGDQFGGWCNDQLMVGALNGGWFCVYLDAVHGQAKEI